MRWLVSCVIVAAMIVFLLIVAAGTMSWSVGTPGWFETTVMTRIKYWRIGGKQTPNPSPDNPETIVAGAFHFKHHCQICHGLDGQNTGVPIATRTTPPVADLASERVQKYTDGQLKWIIDNGIRFSGMPEWRGILEDKEAWAIVRYVRHLPQKGSLGTPQVFIEAEEKHEGQGHEHKHGSEQPDGHSQ